MKDKAPFSQRHVKRPSWGQGKYKTGGVAFYHSLSLQVPGSQDYTASRIMSGQGDVCSIVAPPSEVGRPLIKSQGIPISNLVPERERERCSPPTWSRPRLELDRNYHKVLIEPGEDGGSKFIIAPIFQEEGPFRMKSPFWGS